MAHGPGSQGGSSGYRPALPQMEKDLEIRGTVSPIADACIGGEFAFTHGVTAPLPCNEKAQQYQFGLMRAVDNMVTAGFGLVKASTFGAQTSGVTSLPNASDVWFGRHRLVREASASVA